MVAARSPRRELRLRGGKDTAARPETAQFWAHVPPAPGLHSSPHLTVGMAEEGHARAQGWTQHKGQACPVLCSPLSCSWDPLAMVGRTCHVWVSPAASLPWPTACWARELRLVGAWVRFTVGTRKPASREVPVASAPSCQCPPVTRAPVTAFLHGRQRCHSLELRLEPRPGVCEQDRG